MPAHSLLGRPARGHDGHVRPVLGVEGGPGGVAHALDADGPAAQPRGPVGAGDDDGHRPVDGHVAVEDAQRAGHHVRGQVVVHGQRLAVPHRPGVELGVGPAGEHHRAPVLVGGAQLVGVALGEHGVARGAGGDAVGGPESELARGPAGVAATGDVEPLLLAEMGAHDDDGRGLPGRHRVDGAVEGGELGGAGPHGLVVAGAGEPEGPVQIGDRRALEDAADPVGIDGHAVEVGDGEAGVGQRLFARFDGQGPFAAAGGPPDLGVADPGDDRPLPDEVLPGAHDAGSKKARVVCPSMSWNTTRTGRPMRTSPIRTLTSVVTSRRGGGPPAPRGRRGRPRRAV